MKIKFLTTLVLLVFFFSFSSCKKIDTTEEIPNCIKRKIRKGSRSTLSQVTKYEYKGSEIYHFFNSDIRGSGYILDTDCNELCTTQNDSDDLLKCREILDEATNGLTIWVVDR